MTFNVRTINIDLLNSLTKYPSIPTYHRLNPANRQLSDEHITFAEEAVLTEKVDGTNTRFIILPDETYIIGSREELLYARGDLIGNPVMGIVNAVKPIAETMREALFDPSRITVAYGEVFGGKITANSKQYTSDQRFGFRLFDVVHIHDYEPRLRQSASSLAQWREQGGQQFVDEATLHAYATQLDLPITPRLAVIPPGMMPSTLEDTYEFLNQHMPASLVTLDDGAGGKPEGIVARNINRTLIAKIRFQDYARTLRQKGR